MARIIALAIDVWADERDAGEFLTSPHRLLGGATPIERARSEMGARQVERILRGMEFGLPDMTRGRVSHPQPAFRAVGWVRSCPPAGRPRSAHGHQQVASNLVRVLGNPAGTHGLGEVVPGPVTVHLHDELVVEPDLIFIQTDRLGIVDPDGGVEAPPDLVVEILSRSNRSYDRSLKRKHYLESRIPELWILDADERTVEVWKHGDNEPAVVRDVLEWCVSGHRFEISLDEVFRR